MPRLRRSDPSVPGITRRRRGRGWSYAGPNGDPIRDAEICGRINALVIPPAWTDVWICPWPNGHIQAVGTDAAGRRQYRYHDEWRVRRDAQKFDRILGFAERLPAMRAQIRADLALPGMTRTRVLACAARLLDIGFFRIGGEEYAETNHSYGLATIRREHTSLEGDTITFDYVAKSGKERHVAVGDPEVIEVVLAMLWRDDDGPELLAYQNDDGQWIDVKSRDINAYLGHVSGLVGEDESGEVTAKDFRTWSATVLAAVALAVSSPTAQSVTARKRAISRMYQEVAHHLGNTPAVCRASYVHPRVVDLFNGGVTIVDELAELGADADLGGLSVHGAVEAAVLDMLRDPKARRAASVASRRAS
jgi:DNA topoisomerase IB